MGAIALGRVTAATRNGFIPSLEFVLEIDTTVNGVCTGKRRVTRGSSTFLSCSYTNDITGFGRESDY